MRGRGGSFVAGLLVGAASLWVVAHFIGPSAIASDPVKVLEGRTNGVNVDGTAIGFDGSGKHGEGYVVAGAQWRQDDGPWNDSTLTCLAPLSSDQAVTLGVIPSASVLGGGSRPVVVWLECHGPPLHRG